MELEDRLRDMEFRMYAVETAIRVLAEGFGARDLMEDEEFAAALREEIVQAQYNAHAAADDGDEEDIEEIADDLMAGLRELLAPERPES